MFISKAVLIIIGIVIGAVVVAVVGFYLFCKVLGRLFRGM